MKKTGRFDENILFSLLLAICLTVYAGTASLADRQDCLIKIFTLLVTFTGFLLICKNTDLKKMYQDTQISIRLFSVVVAYLSMDIIGKRYIEDASYYLQKYIPMAAMYHMQFYCCCLILIFIAIYIYYVYIFGHLYRYLIRDIFLNMDATEKIIAGTYMAIMILIVIIAHTHSSAFSYAQYIDENGSITWAQYDAIMDCDSRATFFTIRELSYSARHPFFFFVAMPEYVLSSSISCLVYGTEAMMGLFFSIFSVLKLTACGIWVKRLLNSKWAMLLLYTSYPFILYAIVVERHTFILFWMIFAVYLFCKNKQQNSLPLLLAAGSNTIGLAITPILIDAKSIGIYIKRGIKIGICFIYILIINGKLYGMLHDKNPISSNQKFINRDNIVDNFRNFTVAIKSCFGGIKIDFGAPYATYYDQSGFSIFGLLILVLCLIIGIIKVKEKYARICLYWIIISFITVVIIGFAPSTSSMHMICFSWSFISLMVIAFRCIHGYISKQYMFLVKLGGSMFLLWQLSVNMVTLGQILAYAKRFDYMLQILI